MAGSRIGILYTTSGDWAAVIWQGNLYEPNGDWAGYLVGRNVFSPGDEYLGYVSDDQRVLRKRMLDESFVRPRGVRPPRPQGKPPIPSTVPLPPTMRELSYDLIDMFEEYPERFKLVSDTRPDMD